MLDYIGISTRAKRSANCALLNPGNSFIPS